MIVSGTVLMWSVICQPGVAERNSTAHETFLCAEFIKSGFKLRRVIAYTTGTIWCLLQGKHSSQLHKFHQSIRNSVKSLNQCVSYFSVELRCKIEIVKYLLACTTIAFIKTSLENAQRLLSYKFLLLLIVHCVNYAGSVTHSMSCHLFVHIFSRAHR